MTLKNKNYTNIADILSLQAKIRPDLTAIDTSENFFTYSELNILVSKAAQFLFEHNIKPADIVAVDLDDQLTYIVVMLALAKVGATLFTVSRNTPNLLYNKLLQETDSSILLTDTENQRDIDLPTLLMVLDSIKNISISLDDTVYAQVPESPWQIILGSGTTGNSKLMPVTHLQEIARTEISAKALPFTKNDRVASLIPISFSDTKRRFLETIYAGATFVVLDIDNLTREDLEKKYRLTVLRSTVFHIEKILNSISPEDKSIFDFLKILSIGTASVSDDLRDRIQRHLTSNLFITYGTNETGTITVADLGKDKSISNSVGYPSNGITIEVVDEHDILLRPGEPGTVRIKTPGMINGYIGDDAATKSSFRDGWFYPGDLGSFSESGELIHLGRADQMMIKNGINIYPAKIEKVLISHPKVLNAVAIPIKSSIHQDIPICTVTLTEGSELREKELLRYAYQRLGSSSPERVIVLDSIPCTELGKPDRKEIHKQIQLKLKISKQMIQPRKIFSIKLQKDIPPSLQQIDDWLISVLDIEPEPSTSKPVVDFMNRVLLLNMTLLQSIRIPIFDPGKVISINGSDTKFYTISLSLAYIDHIGNKTFFKSIQLSMQIMLNFFHRDITSQNIQLLYKTLGKEFIEPFKNVSGSGKSTMPVLRETYRKNIPFFHLRNGIYQLGWGSRARKISRSATQFDSAIGSSLSHNKMVASSLIRSAGLPAPEHILVLSKDVAIAASKKLGWPLVLKPADQDRGEGVTVDIMNEASLIKAFDIAYAASKAKHVIVEKQIAGVCCRIFIANDKMLYGVKRLPKGVIGDGIHSIEALIKDANNKEMRLPPWKKTEPFPLDGLAKTSIKNAGFTLQSIPKSDELVPLRRIESTQWGGVDEDIMEVIHKDNVDLARKAARLFNLNVAGIDIITSDISIPWHQSNAIVNEVNFSPQYGGGKISQRSIPAYLSDLIEGDGRIPVTVIIGGSRAMSRALSIQKEQYDNNINSFVSSHNRTIRPGDEEVHFAFTDLSRRCKALLLDSSVDALVLVVQTDELVHHNLPVDMIDDLIIFKEELCIDDPQNDILIKRLKSLTV